MYHKLKTKAFFPHPIALAFAVVSMQAAGQEEGPPTLEEILVTAQKRVESLQEVPISVSAVTGDKLNNSGVENLEDLTALMPNIHFNQSGFSTQVRVRGIGSDNSQGFEQSVGMYIDDIYYGRAQLFRTPMMDMERAELLRGPQSTLFGKNTVAGALNLSTARPTSDFTGRLSASYSEEFGEQEVNGMLSGPVTEELRARLAVRDYHNDGYMYNTTLRRQEPVTDESAARLSLEYLPTDQLSFFLKEVGS